MILSLLLIVLSCTSLSLSAMDPLKLWRAAQETNQPWHRICASVSSASALRELKEGQNLPRGYLHTQKTGYNKIHIQ